MNYIINFNPYQIDNINPYYLSEIEAKIANNESLSQKEATDFLNIIIYQTRYKLNPHLDNYDNLCDLAQSILYYYFKNLNCQIYPSTTQNTITNNIIGHSFLTLKLIVNKEIKYYLLDPTYIQFFKASKCTKENYYIHPKYPNYILLTPDPGFFIKNEMEESAIFLLNHGFIQLNEETARMYGDSFYNTKTGPIFPNDGFKSIPGEVYMNAFLKGNEKLSKSEEELEEQNLNIIPFNEVTTTKKKR